MSRFLDNLYIIAMIGFTVYGQHILKWRIAKFGPLPAQQVSVILQGHLQPM
jgi:hypothetical protein